MKARVLFPWRKVFLIVAVVGGLVVFLSPARRQAILDRVRGNREKPLVVVIVERVWMDGNGSAHGSLSLMNEGTQPLEHVVVACKTFNDRGGMLRESSHPVKNAEPIAPGARYPFEVTVEVSSTAKEMNCTVVQVR